MARRSDNPTTPAPRALDPFRRAVLRGLGVLLPPLLTIVFFLWVANTVANYVLVPMEDAARWGLVNYAADIRTLDELPRESLVNGQAPADGHVAVDDDVFVKTADELFVPETVMLQVRQRLKASRVPQDAHSIYTEYYNGKWYLQRQWVVPVFLCVFVLVMYVLGKFMAAGLGLFFWHQVERVIARVPIVRSVYTSVKQFTDVMFKESAVEFNRVIAVEYPRKGMWSLAFVTGEGPLDVRAAANEPLLAAFLPTSPMIFTGFTIIVKKSETIDIDMTIDQALQFLVSCGVVVAPHQLPALTKEASVIDTDVAAALVETSPLSD